MVGHVGRGGGGREGGAVGEEVVQAGAGQLWAVHLEGLPVGLGDGIRAGFHPVDRRPDLLLLSAVQVGPDRRRGAAPPAAGEVGGDGREVEGVAEEAVGERRMHELPKVPAESQRLRSAGGGGSLEAPPEEGGEGVEGAGVGAGGAELGQAAADALVGEAEGDGGHAGAAGGGGGATGLAAEEVDGGGGEVGGGAGAEGRGVEEGRVDDAGAAVCVAPGLHQ